MRRTLLIALIALIAAIVVGIAQARTFTARTLSDAHVGTSKAELQAQMHYSDHVVRSITRPAVRWKLAPRHATCWSHVPWAHTCNRARTTLIAHRWLYAVAKQRYDKLYAPKPVVVATAGHYALWSCITNGAYLGAAHEGNGYNGRYSGPLGMTTPWAGHMPTGGDWVHTPLSVVYGYAEQEFAANNYSISWLYGQWPNTSPPCVAKLGV